MVNKLNSQTPQVNIYSDSVVSFSGEIVSAITRSLTDHHLFPAEFEIDVNFVDENRMRELNRSFRDRDYATDVLSFGQFEDFINNRPKGVKVPIMLGDLVLCESVIRLEALEEGKNYKEQLLMLVDHGVKHLIGIHHPED